MAKKLTGRNTAPRKASSQNGNHHNPDRDDPKPPTKGTAKPGRDLEKELAEAIERIRKYETSFGEINKFVSLIDEEETEIARLRGRLDEAKAAFDKAKQELAEAEQLREGAKHGLYRFLRPGVEIYPLFDTMEAPNEEKHGHGAKEWRTEPISLLRLSLPSQMALMDADVLLIGQLQDLMQSEGPEWYLNVKGLTGPQALAIADRLADFIRDRSE